MGAKYTLKVWHPEFSASIEHWSGDSLLIALVHLWRHKRKGCKCVTLEVR